MAALATRSLFGRAEPALGRRRSSRFDQHNSRSDAKRCNSCGGREAWMASMALLVCAIIVWPYIVFGPNVVLSVNISPREEYGTDTRRSNVRGLSGRPADDSMSTTAKYIPPEGLQHPLASDLAAGLSSMEGDVPNVGNEILAVDRSGQARKRSGIDAVSGPRDLCLGMAIGLSPAQLVTFAASFREVAPLADLVLFFEAPTSERFKDIIEKYGILSLEIDREKLEPAALRRYHPSSARWVMMQRFLDAKGSEYERVLMVDAGQTLFQGSPFDIIGDPGIYTFMDDKTIGEDDQHSAKIRECLGDSVLTKLANEPALYPAVLLGTLSAAAGYARQMSEGLLLPAFQACEAAGVDAGLHEYLVYGGGMTGVLIFDQATGPVTNMQVGNFEMSGSRIINPSGREVPIVYRYLANATIKESVFRRYIYWTKGEGTGALSPREKTTTVPAAAVPSESREGGGMISREGVAACDQYTLSAGVDLFKAKCDLTNARVGSLGACCIACSGRQACLAFSFDEGRGLCYMKDCDRANPPGPSAVVPSITSGVKSEQTAK